MVNQVRGTNRKWFTACESPQNPARSPQVFRTFSASHLSPLMLMPMQVRVQIDFSRTVDVPMGVGEISAL